MLSSEQKDEECDATKADSSNAVGNINPLSLVCALNSVGKIKIIG
ncbi:MAG: hypothetical protein RIR12_1582 [Bacteroidota bacterium]|jgi:hypothetical protein